jgi:hypothetical protein
VWDVKCTPTVFVRLCVVMAAHELQCYSLPIKILEFYTEQSVEFDMVLNVDTYVIIKGATVVNSCTFLAFECCLDIET